MLPISLMCGVMNAWNTGAEVQIRPSIIKQPWQSCDSPTWDWDHYEYRVKPKPRKFWIVEWPTRWHVFTSLDCAIASARHQVDDTPGVVIEVVEVLP